MIPSGQPGTALHAVSQAMIDEIVHATEPPRGLVEVALEALGISPFKNVHQIRRRVTAQCDTCHLWTSTSGAVIDGKRIGTCAALFSQATAEDFSCGYHEPTW